MAIEVLTLLPGLLLLVLANYTEKKTNLRVVTQIFLLLSVMLALVMGLMMAELGRTIEYEGYDAPNLGAGIAITSVLALLFFLKPIRSGLASFMSINPDNWLHATALVFAILLVGFSLTTALTVDLTTIGQKIDTTNIVLQDIFFVIMAIFGVGWLTRRSWSGVRERLGLLRLTFRDLGISIAYVGLMFAILIVVGLVSLATGQQSDAFEKEDPTLQMLGGVTLLTAIIFSLGAGFGEEILFRGALQPRFGIILTSAVFALAHIQYMNIMSMVTLFGMGTALGYERRKVSTTACIVTHTLYNLTQFLILLSL